jgi:N-acetylmuramoyl-L-alanine amidase
MRCFSKAGLTPLQVLTGQGPWGSSGAGLAAGLVAGLGWAGAVLGGGWALMEMAGVVQTPAAIAQSTARPALQSGSEGPAVKELQATLKLMGLYRGAIDGLYGPGTAAAVAQFQQSAGLPGDGVMGPTTWNRLLPPGPAGAPPDVVNPTAHTHGFPLPGSATSSGSPPANATVNFPAPAPQATPQTVPQAVPQAASPATSTTLPILRLGMSGPAVEALQSRLRAMGVLQGGADGVFGPETEAAVKAAQRTLGLEPDGIVGPGTWMALLNRP